MINIYLFILFLIGFSLYVWNKGLLLCYWYIVQTICLPVVAFVYGAITDEEILEAYGKQNAVINILFLLVFFLEIIRGRINVKEWIACFIPIFLILTYSFFWCVIHNASFEFAFSHRSFVFRTIVIIVFYSGNTTLKQIRFSCLLVLIIELLLALCNHYFGIRLYVGQLFFEDRQLYADEFTSGTFKRFSDLAGFLSCAIVILCGEYFMNKRIAINKFILLFFLTSFVIFLTGSRAALLILVSSCVLYAIFDYKNHKTFLLFFSIGFCYLSILVYLATMSSSVITEESNGFERNVIGLSNKFSNKNKEDTTDDMSKELIDKYGVSLFGLAKTTNRTVEASYGNKNYEVDSRLAFFIVEYGLIYLILSLFYYYYTIKILIFDLNDNEKKNIWILFLFMLFLSITDDGIYARIIFFSIVIYVLYNKKLKLEYERI